MNDHAAASERCNDLIILVLATYWCRDNRHAHEEYGQSEKDFRSFVLGLMPVSGRTHALQSTPGRCRPDENRTGVGDGTGILPILSSGGFATEPLPLK